jgi:hypothetical protein
MFVTFVADAVEIKFNSCLQLSTYTEMGFKTGSGSKEATSTTTIQRSKISYPKSHKAYIHACYKVEAYRGCDTSFKDLYEYSPYFQYTLNRIF